MNFWGQLLAACGCHPRKEWSRQDLLMVGSMLLERTSHPATPPGLPRANDHRDGSTMSSHPFSKFCPIVFRTLASWQTDELWIVFVQIDLGQISLELWSLPLASGNVWAEWGLCIYMVQLVCWAQWLSTSWLIKKVPSTYCFYLLFLTVRRPRRAEDLSVFSTALDPLAAESAPG